ncbi:MAG: putative Signal transduction histidine kinase [Promethearchaeota archaeon]|nr:MAG: putative Signal transduction histidine kinase [Candidatus Lokiarchaeota archaeon]
MPELTELLNNEESINLIKILIKNIHDLAILIDQNYKIKYIGYNSKSIIGFSVEELLDDSLLSFIYHEDREKFIEFHQQLKKGHIVNTEIRLINKNGGFIWFILKGSILKNNRDQDSKIILLLNKIFKDKSVISEETMSNEKDGDLFHSLSEISFWKLLQPKQRVSALKESLKMLQFVLDQMPQYIAWKDKNLTFLGCNINFARVIGYEKPELIIGKTNREIYQNIDIRSYITEREQKVIDSKNPEFHKIESWFKVGNEERFLDVSRVPLRDSTGDVIGILIAYEDITERTKSKKALEQSEKRFRKLTELLPDVVYTVNKEGIITYVNSAAYHMLGYKPEEIYEKMHINNFFPEEELTFLQKNFKKVINGEITEAHEYKMIKKDGSSIYVMLHSRPLFKDEEITGLLGIVHDISKLLKAEKKLKESEKKYRNLAQSLPAIIYEFNKNFELTFVNKSGLEKFGISQDDYKGIKFTEFIAPLDLDPSIRDINKILNGELIEPNDVLLQKKDGSYFYGRSHAKAIYENGEIVGVRGIINDITERKKSELALKKEIEERKKAEAQLKKSEEKYRYLFEGSPYSIWLVRLDGTILDCNTTTNTLLTEHIKEDLIGQNFTEILSLLDKSEHLVSHFKKRFSKIREGKELKPTEVRIQRPKDRAIWINVIGSLIKLGDETLIQVIIQDITENKKAQQKIKESQEKLKELNRELEKKVMERTRELRASEEKLRKQNVKLKRLDNLKNEFIQNAAHELKTPLISISGYTDYLLMKYAENIDTEVKEDLATIKKNVNRLEKLMDQLFEVMKIDEEKIKLKRKDTNIRDLIEECVKDLSYQIKEKNHEVLIDIDENKIINIDRERLSQVFTNLISNAIKFTKENGKIKIIGKERNEDEYLFKVRDNGLGLNSNEIGRLFRKFERIKSPIKHEVKYRGTGLGLYITKGIVNAHGGEIWAESPGPNKGTTILFTIPQK